MLKKVISLIMSIILSLVFTGCGANNIELKGKILMSHNTNIYSQKEDDGMVEYSLPGGNFEILKKGNFYDVAGISYNEDNTKILGCRSEDGMIGSNLIVFEYNIREVTFTNIIENDGSVKGFEGCGSLQYVPNTDNISYLYNDTIFQYDRISETITPLIKVGFDKYSWDKTGEKILYGDRNDKIYTYDIESKKSTQILEGRYPVYSNNSKLIAYQGKDYKLTVYNIDTKEEWKSVSLSGNQEYIFSPDDNYIALATQYSDISNNPRFEMYVVDYKNNKKTKLFKGEGGIPSFDWK